MTKLALSSLLLAFAVGACAPDAAPVIVMNVAAPPSDPPDGTVARLLEKTVPASQPPAKPESQPLDVVVRDRRPNALSPRPYQLVVTEIQGLESLLSAMTTGPDLPKWIRRRADKYGELAAGAPRESTAQFARRAAVRDYETLVQQYPNWCVVPNATHPQRPTGCADEALYYLGLEAERSADFAKARRAYYTLIRQWPASAFIPAVYLAFGEMFVAESAADPSILSYAEQAYLEVFKHALPDDAICGYTWLKLGQAYNRRNDSRRGTDAFEKAMAWSRANPNSLGAGAVAQAAKAAMEEARVP